MPWLIHGGWVLFPRPLPGLSGEGRGQMSRMKRRKSREREREKVELRQEKGDQKRV